MKRKSYKVDIAILIVLVITIFTMSAAYAALSKTLNLTYGNAMALALNWEVYIDGSDSITATATNGATCDTIGVWNHEIRLQNTTFTSPNQKCTYKVPIVNDSVGYDAKIASLIFWPPDNTTCTTSNGVRTCGYATYQLCWDTSCSTNVAVNDIISEQTTRDMYLVISSISSSTYDSSIADQSNGGYFVVFNQIDAEF